MKKYLHLDIDAFFASVEQLDNPHLRGKPVIVGGTRNRGVVATCSYEARAYGVRSAMPAVIARKKCPEGIFLPVRFERYAQKSAEIRAIYTEYSNRYQPVALDEAYLDVSNYDNAIPVALEIKRRIQEETGLTCSIGLSYNMALAKIASDLKKPDAFVVIRKQQALEVLRTLPVGTLHGVGRKSQELLHRRGIYTIEDFWKLSVAELIHMFGKTGEVLYELSRGNDSRDIVMDRPIKSVSRETTLSVDIYERERVAEVAKPLLAEVLHDVNEQGVYPQTLTLKIRFSDFRLRSKQRTVDVGANWSEVLEELLDSFDYLSGVRLVGVGFSNFADESPRYEQLRLFS